MYQYREEPIDILVRELENPYGQLRTLRSKLRISTDSLTSNPLSRRKKPCLTYKLTESTMYGWYSTYQVSWVVKFSPEDKQDDSWYNVYEEHHILTKFDTRTNIPVPKPLHRSSEEERKIVGTKFIIMDFVEGKSFENASSVPSVHRQRAFSSVMKELANVHRYHWVTGYDKQYMKHTSSDSFWQSQVTCWQRNYNAAAGSGSSYGNQGNQQQSDIDKFFGTMSGAVKPYNGGAKIIHGDMDISNIIFDDQYNVKAIVDWKCGKNGDPMVDVGYFCMMFLRPLDYGYQYLPIMNHKLLVDDDVPTEGDILAVYQQNCSFVFNNKLFLYAKAVCCLRLLSVMKAAMKDKFRGHESGAYKDNTSYPQLVMECLTAAGQDYHRRSHELNYNHNQIHE